MLQAELAHSYYTYFNSSHFQGRLNRVKRSKGQKGNAFMSVSVPRAKPDIPQVACIILHSETITLNHFYT